MALPSSSMNCHNHIPCRTTPKRFPHKPHDILGKLLSRPKKPGFPARFSALELSFLFISLLLVLQCLQPGQARSSETPIGRLINPQGQVSVQSAGSTSWQDAVNGRDLSPGDTVKTCSEFTRFDSVYRRDPAQTQREYAPCP